MAHRPPVSRTEAGPRATLLVDGSPHGPWTVREVGGLSEAGFAHCRDALRFAFRGGQPGRKGLSDTLCARSAKSCRGQCLSHHRPSRGMPRTSPGRTPMQEIVHNLMEPSKTLLAQAQTAGRAALSNLEKLATFQMDALERYAELGRDRLEAAAEVRDAASLAAFHAGHVGAMMSFYARLIGDTKALTEIYSGLAADLSGTAARTVQAPDTVRRTVPRKAA